MACALHPDYTDAISVKKKKKKGLYYCFKHTETDKHKIYFYLPFMFNF